MNIKILFGALLLMSCAPAFAANNHTTSTSSSSAATSSRATGGSSTSRVVVNLGQPTPSGVTADQLNSAYSDSIHQSLVTAPAIQGIPLTTSNNTCAGSTSVGGSFMGGAFLAGSTHAMKDCVTQAYADQLGSMEQHGMVPPGTMLRYLCSQKQEIADALYEGGYTCPGQQPSRDAMKATQDNDGKPGSWTREHVVAWVPVAVETRK